VLHTVLFAVPVLYLNYSKKYCPANINFYCSIYWLYTLFCVLDSTFFKTVKISFLFYKKRIKRSIMRPRSSHCPNFCRKFTSNRAWFADVNHNFEVILRSPFYFQSDLLLRQIQRLFYFKSNLTINQIQRPFYFKSNLIIHQIQRPFYFKSNLIIHQIQRPFYFKSNLIIHQIQRSFYFKSNLIIHQIQRPFYFKSNLIIHQIQRFIFIMSIITLCQIQHN